MNRLPRVRRLKVVEKLHKRLAGEAHEHARRRRTRVGGHRRPRQRRRGTDGVAWPEPLAAALPPRLAQPQTVPSALRRAETCLPTRTRRTSPTFTTQAHVLGGNQRMTGPCRKAGIHDSGSAASGAGRRRCRRLLERGAIHGIASTGVSVTISSAPCAFSALPAAAAASKRRLAPPWRIVTAPLCRKMSRPDCWPARKSVRCGGRRSRRAWVAAAVKRPGVHGAERFEGLECFEHALRFLLAALARILPGTQAEKSQAFARSIARNPISVL